MISRNSGVLPCRALPCTGSPGVPHTGSQSKVGIGIGIDGWMGGWKDGWMDGWVDGWMGGWMGASMYIYVRDIFIKSPRGHLDLF